MMGSSVERTDENVREYLLYRGFTSTLRHLDSEIKVDKDKGFRVDKMVQQLLHLVDTFDLAGLREYWFYLERRLFSHLEDVYSNTVNKLRTSLYRYYVVNTIQKGRLDITQEFFQKQGAELHGQTEWRDWFSLPFIPSPEQHPIFAPYFSRQWADTFLVSLSNFLSVLFQCMPQPALLSFDAELQRSISLTEENEQLRQLVFALQGSSGAGMKDQSESSGEQAPPHHKLPAYVQNMDRLGDTELDMVSNQKSSSVSTTPSRNFFSTFLPQGKRTALPPAGGNKVGLSPNQSSVGRKEPAAAANQAKTKDGPSGKEVKPSSNQAAPSDSQAPPTQTRQKRTTQEHEKERKELFSKPVTSQVVEKRAETELDPSSYSSLATTIEAPIDAAPDPSLSLPDSAPSAAANEKEVGSVSVDTPFIKLSQEEYGEHHSSILHCRVDCSGRRVASLDVDGVVKVWSFNPVIQTKATIMSKSPLLSLEWATKPDRLLLLGSAQGTVRLYDTDAKKNLIEMNVDEAHPRILSLACSPSGSSFVCSAAAAESNLRRPALAEGKLLLWDTKTVKEQLQFSLEPRPVAINCTAFNHNGNLLVTGAADGVIRLFDMQRYECAMSWRAHDGEVYTVEFSRDENTVFTVGEDGKFVQWNIHQCGVKLSEQELPQDATGPFVLSGYSGYKQVQVPRGRLFAFDSEGQHVLTCSNTGGVIYQLTNGEEPWLNNVLSLGGHRVSVVTVDWCCAVDCGACLTGSMDGKIRLSTLLAHKTY